MTRALTALVMWVLLSIATAAPASAHAVLLGTSPVDGEVVSAAPDAVVLTFNEPVELREVTLVEPSGPQTLDARVVDAEIHAPLPAGLDDGTYVVNWRVVSDDGHPIGGAFTFSIGHETNTVAAGPSESTSLTWTIRVAQSLAYLGPLVACGLALFAAWAIRGTPTGRDDRLRTVGIGALVVAAVGLVIGLPAAEADANGDGPAGLLSASAWTDGIATAGGFAALLGFAGAVVAVFARNATLRTAGAVIGLGSLLITGHTRTFGPAVATLGADLVHVVAVGAWIGGLAGLVLLIGSPALHEVIARFSKLASALLAGVVVSGLVLGWRIVGTFDALFSTTYGTVLLIKVGLVLVAMSLAFLNRRWLASPNSSSLRGEVAILAAITAVTGVLVHLNPTPAVQEHTAAKTVDGVVIHASISPCRPGDNTVTLMVHGGDVQLPEITARTADGTIGPLNLVVREIGDGRYTAEVKLVVEGEWTIDIGVRVSTYQEATAILTCTP